MKCSVMWLQEWVKFNCPLDEIVNLLTMAGLEVESIHPVAATLKKVVIGQVIAIEKHPEAARLQICKVDVGASKPLNIVCGASNVSIMMKAPVALIGAQVQDQQIKATNLRGVPSEGMLCSASELGLAETSDGLLVLAQDAPVGIDINDYLQLQDQIIDLSVTPNRGDCLSVKGIAREIATLTQTTLIKHNISDHAHTDIEFPIRLTAKEECPRYVGRVIQGIRLNTESPVWLKERLRRSGIRSIHPVVDITNYVMLELGQPMHAFDLKMLNKEIQIRHAKKGESLLLLDDTQCELDEKTLIIADAQKPLAIAGVMGGMDSAVMPTTTDIFLESAFFKPEVVSRQRQHYQLHSDSAYRFERGVDPMLQYIAIERATQLITEVIGGDVGPIVEVQAPEYLPQVPTITLALTQINQVLGLQLDGAEVEKILQRLHFDVQPAANQTWRVKPPSYRSDILLAEDLIEEIARIYGYDNIPTHSMQAILTPDAHIGTIKTFNRLRQNLRDQDFHEIITYSFVEQALQSLVDPDQAWHELVNPITAEMTVMRTNLWPGLINTLLYNKSRQQQRVRLFEIGTCFKQKNNAVIEENYLAGLMTGDVASPQWGIPTRASDFYDLKGSLSHLLESLQPNIELTFKKATHPALHPGQTASIHCGDVQLGILGALHPHVLQTLDLSTSVYVFELNLDLLSCLSSPPYQEISKFPEIRRDLAILINQAIPAEDIQATIKAVADDWLKDIFIFDVYQGKGISAGLKSVALALILQHPTRTLVDEEVAEFTDRIVKALQGQLGAVLRS